MIEIPHKVEIQQILKGDAKDDPETLHHYSGDASAFRITPELVVFPKDVDDIKKVVNKVVNYVTGKKTAGDDSISLTPHSCGTDMAGGDLNKSIILDVNAHMNKIIDIGSESAIVQPGVPFRLFEKESPKYKSMLPSYPAPKSMASVGGTVANNSGGEKSLRYGQTKTTSKLLKSSLETEMNKNLKNSIEKSWMKN